ncbi:MAG: hypothetical protein ABR915_22420 [Thermoguttaceae bacterium]|jgi:hypothetical protein
MTKIVSIQGQQKWECCYESRKTETSLLIEINRLGQEGWEIVEVLYYKDQKGAMCWTAFLKRPSTGQAPPPAASPQAATVQPPATTESTPSHEGFDLSDDEFKLAPE